MKVKQLIEILSDCDPEAYIELRDISRTCDVILLTVRDTDEDVIFNVKTYFKTKEDKDKDKVH